MTYVINSTHAITTHVIKREQLMAKRGKRFRLGAGELELLQMLWRRQPVSISEAHEALGRRVGYTTVQTRLNRLVAKNLARKTGSHPALYRAAIGPEEVSRQDLDLLVDRVTAGRVVPLVAHLVKDRELSAQEIQELKELIDEVERQNSRPSEPVKKPHEPGGAKPQ
jgi:predicted transcriptional regulator